VTVRRYEAVKG